MYIHDPKVGKHVIVAVQANEIEDWCVDRETDRQTARGLIPAEGTTDGENGEYREPAPGERLAAIS